VPCLAVPWVERRIEALNHAIEGIWEDRVWRVPSFGRKARAPGLRSWLALSCGMRLQLFALVSAMEKWSGRVDLNRIPQLLEI
jgi:hypothetical protein